MQDNNIEIKKLQVRKLPGSWEDIKRVLHFKDFFYVPENICSELISNHYDDFLAEYFGIDKTQELIARKYY